MVKIVRVVRVMGVVIMVGEVRMVGVVRVVGVVMMVGEVRVVGVVRMVTLLVEHYFVQSSVGRLSSGVLCELLDLGVTRRTTTISRVFC